MSGQTRAQQVDEILAPFLKATQEAESADLLERLIDDHAVPIIREVARLKLRPIGHQDTDDVVGEAVLQLVKKLREIKSNPNSQVFSNFRGYVAVVAYNTCYKHLRERYPERSRLKNKLRYLLAKHKDFAIWESENRQWYCGLAAWQNQGLPVCGPGRLHLLQSNSQAVIATSNSYGHDLAGLLTAIFVWSGAPIEFDDLVDTVALLWQITDQATQTGGEDKELPDEDRMSIAETVEQRLYLQSLWSEICDLPLDQRRALLLNLRDDQGCDITTLLSHARIATLREISQALALTAEEFARLWNELPLDDSTIAASLGVSRQRVINLRNAARKRLARRMKKFEESEH